MLKVESIPSGYQLHVTTWENDADDYRTKIISGLSKDDAKFYIDLAHKFVSKNNWKGPKGLGNGSTYISDLHGALQDSLDKYPNISKELRDYWNSAIEVDDLPNREDENLDGDSSVYWKLCEILLASPVSEYYRWDCHHFCRVFDRFEVWYIPEDAKEVTNEFKSELMKELVF